MRGRRSKEGSKVDRVVVKRLAGGMNEDELKRQALALFGGKRMTDGIAALLTAGIKLGLETGRLERDGRGLYRAG